MENRQVVEINVPGAPSKLRRPPRRRGPFNRLKPERVEEELKRMRGWSLGPDGQSLQRVRKFRSVKAAAAYAVFASEMAASARPRVSVRLDARQVSVLVQGRDRRGRRAALSMADLDLARDLG